MSAVLTLPVTAIVNDKYRMCEKGELFPPSAWGSSLKIPPGIFMFSVLFCPPW